MSFVRSELAQWRHRPVRELLAGAVATFALIPEVIAFSFVAGVDPEVGLYASFVISIVIAFAGGRPAMISAAAGSVALVAAPLVALHGINYLLAAGVLAGLFQVVFGLLRLGVLMRFVSSSVRTGFVNALAVLIFSAQLPQLAGATTATWVMLAVALAIIYGLPRIALPGLQAIPSPLICIVVLTLLCEWMGLSLKTVGDLGKLPSSLPSWHGIGVPLNLETLHIIAGPALAIAMVGVLESLMTARVVDELTDSPSSKSRECAGLGLANIAASLFGGIAGCGMIGQTVGNVRYGGRGRLSTLFAGVFLLILMVLLKPWVSQVPVVALVAIMVMVSVSTFDWGSMRKLVEHPRLSSLVMISTVTATLLSHDLSIGVGLGVLLSALFFAWKAAGALHVQHVQAHDAAEHVYQVRGQVFFASADAFVDAFDPRQAEGTRVQLDVSLARFWDVTALAALDKVRERFEHYGCTVEVVGLQSRALLPDGVEDVAG